MSEEKDAKMIANLRQQITDLQRLITTDAQAEQVRLATIEQCAKACEARIRGNDGLEGGNDWGHNAPYNAEDKACAAAIRALAAQPSAAPVETDVIAVDAKLLHSLWCYGQLHTVEGVVYSYGTHQKCLDAVDDLIADHAAACEANPHNGSSAGNVVDLVARLREPVMLRYNAEQINAERREAAGLIERLSVLPQGAGK